MTPLVERLARALGVDPKADGFDRETAPMAVSAGGPDVALPGPYIVWLANRDPSLLSQRHVVDEPTALLALLAYARGLEVDLGPCPACGGSGQETKVFRGPQDRRGHADIQVLLSQGFEFDPSRTQAIPLVRTLVRSCPACAVDGQPIGRDVRPLVRVLLDSMPRDAMRDERGNSFRLMGNGYAMPVVSGDPASRERLAVRADELAQAGDPLAEPLAAFLGVECRACEGFGRRPTRTVRTASGGTAKIDVAACPDCNGHGTLLGALAPTLEEMAAEEWRARTVECEACRGLGWVPSDSLDIPWTTRCESCRGDGWVASPRRTCEQAAGAA